MDKIDNFGNECELIQEKTFQKNSVNTLKTNQENIFFKNKEQVIEYDLNKNIASFRILGNKCCRNCKSCKVEFSDSLEEIDEDEPNKILKKIEELGLNYVIVKSVPRDDLEDNGASHFVKVIRKIKDNTDCKVEVIIPDFQGRGEALVEIIKSRPDVINHSVGMVERLFPIIRPNANYQSSLEQLKRIRGIDSQRTILIKSNFNIGLGESIDEIAELMVDLKKSNVDIVSIRQYNSPSSEHWKVVKIYSEEEFEEMRNASKILKFSQSFIGNEVKSFCEIDY
jgi:lipoyl synthase